MLTLFRIFHGYFGFVYYNREMQQYACPRNAIGSLHFREMKISSVKILKAINQWPHILNLRSRKKSVIHSKQLKKICSDICARTLFVQRCENCKLWGQIFDGFEGKLSTTMYCEGRILGMYNDCASGEFKITRNKFFVTPSQSCYLTFSELGNLTANFNVLIGSPKAGVY